MTAPVSSIPAAVDGLLQVARTALPAVSVVDGPPLTWDGIQLGAGSEEVTDKAYVFVGASPSQDSIASAEMDFAESGNVSRDELGQIRCTVLCWSGDGVVRPLRVQVFEILTQLEAAIRQDRSLGGAVLYSRIGSVDSVDQDLDDTAGATVTAEFTVQFRSYIS